MIKGTDLVQYVKMNELFSPAELASQVLLCKQALALQNHATSFFPARSQSPKISAFDKIFAISE